MIPIRELLFCWTSTYGGGALLFRYRYKWARFVLSTNRRRNGREGVKSILATVILISVFAASDARADQWCSLTVNPSSYVEVGHTFSYGIDIAGMPWPGPTPPGGNPSPPFTVVFYGTKNGVADIPAGGEVYPATFGYGHSDLTGYVNPGGFSGTYLRYAVVHPANYPNYVYCVTNTVAVVLQ